MMKYQDINELSFKGGRRERKREEALAKATIARSKTKDTAMDAANSYQKVQSRHSKNDRRDDECIHTIKTTVRSSKSKSDMKMTNQQPQHKRHSNTRSTSRHKDIAIVRTTYVASLPAFFKGAGSLYPLVVLAFFFLLTNSVLGSATFEFMVNQGNEMLRSGYVYEGADIFRKLLADQHLELSQFDKERLNSRLQVAKASMSVEPIIAGDYTKQVHRLCEQATKSLYSGDNEAKALASLKVGLELLELAACHRGRDEDYRKLMATCLIYQGRHREGLHFLRKVAKERANEPSTWNLMAWYYRSIGKKKLELKALNRSVMLDSDQKYVQARRCQLLVHFDTPPLIEVAYETAIKSAGDDMAYLEQLSQLFPTGKYREGLLSIVRNKRISKVHSGTAYVMGVSHYKAPPHPESSLESDE